MNTSMCDMGASFSSLLASSLSSLSFTFLVALLPLHFIMLSAPSMNELISPVHVNSFDTA